MINEMNVENDETLTNESPILRQIATVDNDDTIYYSLVELDAMEEDLAKQAMAYGGS